MVCLGKNWSNSEGSSAGLRIREWYGTSAVTPEQIIAKLRQVDVLVERGATAVEACRQVGIAEQTLYRWRKEYGGLKVDQARRMKDLERENVRLKKLMAGVALDKAILQEASSVLSPSRRREAIQQVRRVLPCPSGGPARCSASTARPSVIR
jgi:transposase-like protein